MTQRHMNEIPLPDDAEKRTIPVGEGAQCAGPTPSEKTDDKNDAAPKDGVLVEAKGRIIGGLALKSQGRVIR